MSIVILWSGFMISSIALIIYFRGWFQPRPLYQVENIPSPETKHFANLVANLSDSYIATGAMTGFWIRSEQINQARISAIASAQKSILFETYKMDEGDRARNFALAMTKKARSGVKVKIIADSYGSKSIPQSYWQNLSDAGVEVRFFNRFTWKYPLAYLERNHRKLLIIDNEKVYLGGAGVSDDWDGDREIGDTAPWLDYEVSFVGSAIDKIKGIFWQHWLNAGGKIDLDEESWQVPDNHYGHFPLIVTSAGDPTYRDSSIRSLFHFLVQSARHKLWIASPYFLPTPNTRRILLEAKNKGVDLKILTMGETCDKPYIHYTSRELYRDLLAGGIEIYEYQPSMMHAKAVLVDDRWISIGSANFDPRSFFKNDELNLSTSQPDLIEKMNKFFVDAFADANLISDRLWSNRPLKQRLTARFWLLFYWLL